MIYLDHHAACPTSEQARDAMEAAREDAWGNPASVHAAGRRAHALVDAARRAVAAAIGAEPADIVLTSGGTEACNLGVLGAARPRAHIVTTTVEHPAVAEAIARAEARGSTVTRLGVARGAPPEPDAVARAITGDTSLVAIQWVNHETGTLLPIAEYGAVCRARGVTLFVDGTQAFGKVPIDVSSAGADLVALASHKMGGPSGAGGLWARRGVDVAPVLAGGAQERGRRPGSPDVLALVGFGAAARGVGGRLASMTGVSRRRDRLEAGLVHAGGVVNGEAGPRVATVTNVSFAGRRGDTLVAALDLEGVCVSSGAACSSGLAEPSRVLAAMYAERDAWRAAAALRASLGPETTDDDVDGALEALARVLARCAGRKS